MSPGSGMRYGMVGNGTWKSIRGNRDFDLFDMRSKKQYGIGACIHVIFHLPSYFRNPRHGLSYAATDVFPARLFFFVGRW